MKTTNWFHLVVLLMVSMLVAACVPGGKAPIPGRTPLSAEAENQLLNRLQDSSDWFRSLDGIARVHVVWQGKSTSTTQALLAEKPDLLRVETLNPFGFGSPLMVMATDGTDMAVMIPAEGLMFRGAASSQNLQRFTKLPLRLTDLVHLLLYQVPMIPEADRSGSVGADGDSLIQLHGADDFRQELRFDPERRLVASTYYRGDELTLRVGYSDFSAGEHPFPHAAVVEMPQQQAVASLTFSELTTNVASEPWRFRLSTPSGYQERPIP